MRTPSAAQYSHPAHPEIINRYGLTKWDAGKIRPYINRFNRKAKTKIRAEFDKLAALDFIREELEKSGTK